MQGTDLPNLNSTELNMSSFKPVDTNQSAGLLGATTSAHERLAQAQTDSEAAQRASEQANSPAGIGMEALNQAPNAAVKVLADPAAKFAGSAVRSPIDIVRGLFGMKPLADKMKLPSGEETGSIQSNFAENGLPQVESGQQSPFGVTAGVLADTVGGATDVLGAGEALKGVTKAVAPVAEFLGKQEAKSFAESASKKAVDIVSPRLTPQVAENATTKTSFLRGKISIVPDDRTNEMADAVKNVVQGKSYSQDKELVKQAIGNEAETLKQGIQAIDHPVPKRELISTLTKSERPVLIASDKTMNNAYDKVLNKASEIIDKKGGTASGLLDGRKDFDSFVEKQFPNLYNSDAMTPMRIAIKDIRGKWNDFVGSQLESVSPKGSFAEFHPDDQKFLNNFSEKVASKQPIPESLMNRAKETLNNYGYNAPESKTGLADYIKTAQNSIEGKAMGANMDNKLRGVDFKASLRKQNLMYDALDNISEKAAKGAPTIQGEIGTTRAGRFAEKHPTLTKIGKWGAGITGAAVGAGEIQKHAP